MKRWKLGSYLDKSSSGAPTSEAQEGRWEARAIRPRVPRRLRLSCAVHARRSASAADEEPWAVGRAPASAIAATRDAMVCGGLDGKGMVAVAAVATVAVVAGGRRLFPATEPAIQVRTGSSWSPVGLWANTASNTSVMHHGPPLLFDQNVAANSAQALERARWGLITLFRRWKPADTYITRPSSSSPAGGAGPRW
jgi:hypothetical protein